MCRNEIQQVSFDEHTIYYCPTCQTDGRVLSTGGYRGCCEIERNTMASMSQTETEIFANDLQAASPEVHLALTRAGVTGVHKVIRITHAGSGLVY